MYQNKKEGGIIMESFLNYEQIKKDIPQKVHTHLEVLVKELKLPQNESTMKNFMESWLTKRAVFMKMAEHENFKKVKTMKINNKNGCIALTFSGSIISIGPLVNDKRDVKYTSIGIRTDVPESIKYGEGILTKDIFCDESVFFKEGPIKKTSPIMDLAIIPDSETDQEQLESIEKANIKLKDNFLRINQETLNKEKSKGTAKDKDTIKSRNDLFLKWIIIEWFKMGGIEEHIFIARAKMLWQKLFTKVYTFLSKNIADPVQKDNKFLEFTNNKFAKFVDDYKWYESEKKDFDIGLMKSLEELPKYEAYLNYLKDYKKGFK